MVRALFLALALTTLAAGTAVAQDRVDTEFTFLDEHVRGEPDGTNVGVINVAPRPMRHTLVQPRTHFIGEMLHSVENL